MSGEQKDSTLLYREVQYQPMRWILIPVAPFILFSTVYHVFYSGKFGDHQSKDFAIILLGIIIGLIVPWIVHLISVTIEVHHDRIKYFFRSPFKKAAFNIPLIGIDKYEINSIVFSRKGRNFMGFSTGAVKFNYLDGDVTLIGSQNPAKLIDVLDQILHDEKKEVFLKTLIRIQPTQAYINAEHLAQVVSEFDPQNPDSMEPLPIVKLGDDYVFTGGHTHAFAALFRGVSQVKVKWDYENMDLTKLDRRMKFCRNDGLRTIRDLRRHIVSAAVYKEKWLDRIDELDL